MAKAVKKDVPFDFDVWVTEQAGRIEAEICAASKLGTAWNLAAWVVPSSRMPPGEPGYIHVGTEAPFFGADVVHLGPHGTTLARCPYSHIRGLLWNAARSYRVLPIPADA